MKPAAHSQADPSRIAISTRRVAAEEPLAVLAALPEGQRFAWLGPDEAVVATGVTARLEATGPDRFVRLHEAAARLWMRLEPRAAGGEAAGEEEDWQQSSVPAPRLLGGFSFQVDPVRAGPWQPFPGALFVLPEQLWHWREGVCHVVEARAEAETPDERDDPARPRLDVGTGPGSDMTRDEWEDAVAEVLLRIRAHELKKVVIARSHVLPPVDPVLLLGAFPEEPGTYRFLFEPAPGHAFVGASPEHLVTLKGDRIEAAALAGTAPRGRDSAHDARLAEQLRASTKDNVEHALIVAWLDERLAAAGATDIRYGRRRLRRLRHVQHLETLILAKAAAGTDVLRLVDRLHPTPAVGGLPVEEACRLVRRLETAPRGWYAGGVGFFTPNGEGTFVTAIRSALATRTALTAYAGAGIVPGSDSAREWEETQWKFRPVEEAAGNADPDRRDRP